MSATIETAVDPKVTARWVLDEWVPRLRSGEYKQGKGALRTVDNTFCCLGVACDILNSDGWTQSFSGDYCMVCGDEEGDSERTVIPKRLAETVGLDRWGDFGNGVLSEACSRRTNDEYLVVTGVNDDEEARYDFKFIADLLQEAALAVLGDE